MRHALTRGLPLVPLLLLVLSAACGPFGGTDADAPDFGQPVAGQRVYDRAGVLTPAEVAELAARADAVAQAGAPVVVLVQLRDVSYGQTVDDSETLMQDWDVQSAPDAHDGVVLLVNLQTSDPRHGHFALRAGARHYNDDGALPQHELDRIADAMQPLLADGRIADGLALGLDAVAHDLAAGPPPAARPSAFRRAMADVSRGPVSALNLAALAIALALAGWLWRAHSRQPQRAKPPTLPPTISVPAELPPGLAGALTAGTVTDAQLEATLLDLARRGALGIETTGKRHQHQLRLLDGTLARPGYETAVWHSLATHAADGVVPNRALARLRTGWSSVRDMLRADLVARGWFDPQLSRRQRPFLLAGFGAMALAVLALLTTALGDQVWGLAGAGLLVVAALFGFVLLARVPHLTPDGDVAAAPWRAYREGLRQNRDHPQLALDLDVVLPYAVGLGVTQALNNRLKDASAEGYAPAWFALPAGSDGGFYPYWIAFHGSVAPSAGAGAGGGAAAGSGASGGSF
jgi:uncharacterized membrane protein YgcG